MRKSRNFIACISTFMVHSTLEPLIIRVFTSLKHHFNVLCCNMHANGCINLAVFNYSYTPYWDLTTLHEFRKVSDHILRFNSLIKVKTRLHNISSVFYLFLTLLK